MTGKRELGSILGFQLSLMKLVEVTGLTVKTNPEDPEVHTGEMEDLVRRVINRMGPTIQ